MYIAIVPALLLGLGARILFDHFSRFDGPSLIDFILFGAWQGVALHYATKAGFGIIVAFGSATKLFIELDFILDVARCVTILLGISLGVLFTDFLYQHFEKPRHLSDRRRKRAPTPQSQSLVQSQPRESVETIIDPAPNAYVLSNIAVVDSGLGLSPLLSERRGAVSQGDISREAELKATNSEVTSTNSHHQDDEEEQELAAPSSRENGDCEADLKAMEVSTSSHQDDKEVQEQTYSSPREEGDQLKSQTHPSPEYCEAELKPLEVSTNSHHQEDKEVQEQTASSSREKGKELEKTHPEYGKVVGIDLGTTYSRVGVYKSGRVEIIYDDQGNRIKLSWGGFHDDERLGRIENDLGTASWVGFHGDELLIGDSAKDLFHSNPKNTVFDVKRLIGCTMEEVKRDLKHLPFTVKEKNGAPVISVTYENKIREFTPEEISAMILKRLKETAEAHLGYGVTHAVVTVPSHFNNTQRQATKNAGEIAGLKVLRVLNDPIAAALAHKRGKIGSELLIVYDLGGGTFDVSLLSINEGVFKVLATAGDTHLGGEDFNNRVTDYLTKAYNKKTRTDVSSNQRAMSKLREAVELAKRTLSMRLSAKIEIESFENGNGFLETLTRSKFEELNLELFKRTIKLVEQVLKDAKVAKSEIDEVILVGGSTRIPKIQELLKDYFGKEPSRDINPDEAVVVGATIQAAMLSGEVDITVLDVNTLTRGIEVNGGAFAPIIMRNTPIPTKKSRICTTAIDKQTTVMIKVFEGDGEQTKFNHLLGEYKLIGIPRAPKGVPQIEVTYELDADSILTVKALDKRTGNSELMVFTTKDRRILSQEAINRMVAKGEKDAAKDLRHEKWRDRRGVPRIGN